MDYGFEKINNALQLLDGRLRLNQSGHFSLVVCGGAALNAMHLIERTTKDVDIVALMDAGSQLLDPAPLPQALLTAASEVANTLRLPSGWLNNGPSSGDGGLFRFGLPDGFKDRLVKYYQGQNLTVYVVSRFDQIHFKLYAAIDQFGSYHASDLRQLVPSDEELLAAVRWAATHDPSEGFRAAAQLFLRKFGYDSLADKI